MWVAGKDVSVPTIVEANDPTDPMFDDFRALNSSDRRPDLPEGKGLVSVKGYSLPSVCWVRGSGPALCWVWHAGWTSSRSISPVWRFRLC